MNIGVVTEYYYPTVGGVQEAVYHFSQTARSWGHDVKVITGGVADAKHDPHVVRLGRTMPITVGGSTARVTIGLDLARSLRRVFERERFDIVHIHSPFLPTLPYLAERYAPAPTVGTLHTNFDPIALVKVFRGLLRQRLEMLDGLVSVSANAARSARENLGYEKEIRIIPNGVDFEAFANRGRRIPRFDDGQVNLFFLARLEPRNGVAEMLRAFAKVAKEEPNVRLIVAGDGPRRAVYESMVPPDLRPRVLFVGSILEDRPDYFATADVLLAPMLNAAFSVLILEAMAAGVPIIGNNIEGFRQAVQHEQQALLVDVRDMPSFADAMLRLIRDADLRRRMGAKGRETARRYAWPIVTREVLDYYDEVLRAA